jgi:hypothetical protein
MKIIQIIKIKAKHSYCLSISGTGLDNCGFISFLINFLLMIIMKMIILLGIFLLKIINGRFNLDGVKLMRTHLFISMFTTIKKYVVLRWIQVTIFPINNKDFWGWCNLILKPVSVQMAMLFALAKESKFKIKFVSKITWIAQMMKIFN